MPSRPSCHLDSSGYIQGHHYTALKAILADKLDYQLVGVPMPWKRVQNEVKLGHIDIMLTVITKARLEYAVASSSPLYTTKMKLYTYAQHPMLARMQKITSVDDILELGLTSVINMGNGWYAENIASKGVHTIYSTGNQSTVIMLANKRADITIATDDTTRFQIKKSHLGHAIIDTGVILGAVDIHIFMSKKSRHIASFTDIDAIITQHYRSGRFDILFSPESP